MDGEVVEETSSRAMPSLFLPTARSHRTSLSPETSATQVVSTFRRILTVGCYRQAKCSRGGPGLLEQLHTELGCLSFNSTPPSSLPSPLAKALSLLLLLRFFHSMCPL